MKFIVKIIRNSITRALYRQRRLAANAARHQESDYLDNEQYSTLSNLHHAVLSFSQQEMNKQRKQTYTLSTRVQTNGLLDLGNAQTPCSNDSFSLKFAAKSANLPMGGVIFQK